MSKKLVGKARQRERKKNRTRNGNGVSVQSNSSDEELLRHLYNSSPTMIHENDYVPMNCVICGTEMKSIHDTHNPQPITDKCFAKEALEEDRKDRCCNNCNKTVVLPARFGSLGLEFDPEMLSKTEPWSGSKSEVADTINWDSSFKKDVA